MSDRPTSLTSAERAVLYTSLAAIRDRLDLAREVMVAIHINQAIECLDPDGPMNVEGISLEG